MLQVRKVGITDQGIWMGELKYRDSSDTSRENGWSAIRPQIPPKKSTRAPQYLGNLHES